MKKKKVYLILSIQCMVLIFFLSAQDGAVSDTLSKQVTNTVNTTAGFRLSSEDMRGIAHFVLYLFLGVFVSAYLFNKDDIKYCLLAFGICFIYAISEITSRILCYRQKAMS